MIKFTLSVNGRQPINTIAKAIEATIQAIHDSTTLVIVTQKNDNELEVLIDESTILSS